MLKFVRNGASFKATYKNHAFLIRAVVNGIELQIHNGDTGATAVRIFANVGEATKAAEEAAGKL